ncbi:MAG: 16S rRNA processing protein RimM [Bacteroidaceae bacterium]|jgi:16S rRNA processing protein RimM|nr:16S rRNA processing protein RimM [Bacteroidaceae bacterium]MBO7267046.1 16S rRNA processing protein RimM [Bacteroidaceae bacterium]
MIRPEEVYCIGKFTRPHGVQGEMAMSFTDDVFDRTDCPYLVCSMDGILVPFFIEEYRFKSNNVALIKFERIDTNEAAAIFTNKEVYFPKSYADEADDGEYSWQYFIGFDTEDVAHGHLGELVDVDESTVNTLFVVECPNGDELLIPAQEAFIDDIDHEKRLIKFNLPDGLL